MKKGWEEKTLGQVCELLNRGISPKYLEKNGICVLNQKCIRNHQVNFEESRRHDSTAKTVNPERYLQVGDILVNSTGTGTLGRVAQVCEKPKELTTVDSHVTIVRPQQGLFYKDFFGYMLIRIEDDIKLAGEGCGGQIELARSILAEKFIIKYPKSIPEQKRIVAILDEAFSAVAKAKANAEQNLKNAKELFESYLQSVFENKGDDWEHLRLGDLCQINDGTHFSPPNTLDGKYKYITAKNIKPYYIDLTKISYISEKDHKEIYARCSPIKGDVLYIKDGATAGIATINTLDEEFSLLSSVALLKCSSKILNMFLVHYMNSIIGKKNFLGYIGGAAITRLTLVKIKNVCLAVPPIKVQQTIVKKFDSLAEETKKLESIYQQKIADLEELKKTILQKAFNGELNLDSVAV